MKPPLRISPLFFVTALTLPLISVAHERVLELRCAPVVTSVSGDNPVIWKFTPIEETRKAPFYKIYGDTLTTEIVGKSRLWYSHHGDSTFYIGEESRSHTLTPDKPIPTSVFGKAIHSSDAESVETGMLLHTYTLGQTLTYSSTYPREGLIELSDGMTIRAYCVTETRTVNSVNVDNDSVKEVGKIISETSRSLWFTGSDPLPIAMQIEKTNPLEVENGTTSETFLYSDYASVVTDADDSMLRQALEDAEITVSGGRVYINGDFPDGISMELNLSTLSGLLLWHMDTSVSGCIPADGIPFSDVPPGDHMLTVTIPLSASRKMLVTVR